MSENGYPIHLIEEMSLDAFKYIIKNNPQSVIDLLEYWEKKMKIEPIYERSGCNDPTTYV